MQRASIPQIRVTVTTGGVATVYPMLDFTTGRIVRNENNFDTATLQCDDYLSKNYPGKITSGSLIQVEGKDASDSSWTSILTGIILQGNLNLEPVPTGEFLTLICSGSGYGFKMCLINAEYGAQSGNATLDTLQEIIIDASHGIVPKYVNKILGGAVDSGYSYTADSTTVEDIAGTMQYLGFPYKPVHNALQDLCELLQAIKGASAGPHWIVTTDKKLLVTTVGAHHAGAISNGWTTYYGGSQAKATLEQGLDFTGFNFQKLIPEANHIVYYGLWRRPSSGDGWTEANAANWLIENDAGSTLVLTDDSVHQVGAKSLMAYNNYSPPAGTSYYSWPHNKLAAWNFNVGTSIYIPYLSFYARRHEKNYGISWWGVYLKTDDSNYFSYVLLSSTASQLPTNDTWYYFHLPIGPAWRTPSDFAWTITGNPDWANINRIEFYLTAPYYDAGDYMYYIDGLHFGDIPICRIAKNSTNITVNNLRCKPVIDDIGKDDSLNAADDSGLMAQMALAELLRSQTTPIVGTVTVAFIKDLLPGQLLHIHAKKTASGSFNINKDMRVTKVEHSWNNKGVVTKISLTDDVINANTRSSYTDINTVFKAIRPDSQDRQATSISRGILLDTTVPIFEKDYPS
jgi:hypothetical protein